MQRKVDLIAVSRLFILIVLLCICSSVFVIQHIVKVRVDSSLPVLESNLLNLKVIIRH